MSGRADPACVHYLKVVVLRKLPDEIILADEVTHDVFVPFDPREASHGRGCLIYKSVVASDFVVVVVPSGLGGGSLYEDPPDSVEVASVRVFLEGLT